MGYLIPVCFLAFVGSDIMIKLLSFVAFVLPWAYDGLVSL